MKDTAAITTDEEEPEVRRSSRLAENSPVRYENLLLSPETPLPFGQELFLDETLVINPVHLIMIRLALKKKTSL